MKMTKKILIIGSDHLRSACIRLLREENIQIYLLDGKDLLNIENSGCIYSLIHEEVKAGIRNYLKTI